MLWQPSRGLLQPNQHWRRPQTPAAGGPSLPALSGTVLAWYTAKAGVTLSGANVTGWADQSASGAHIVAGNNPTYSATAFNSKYPGIITSASNQYLRTAEGAIATGGVGAMSFWMVLHTTNSTPNSRFVNVLPKGEANAIDYSSVGGAIAFLGKPDGSGDISCYYAGYRCYLGATNGSDYRAGMVFGGSGIGTIGYLNGVQQSTDGNINPARWGKSGIDLVTLAIGTLTANDGSGNFDPAQLGSGNCPDATFAEVVMMTGAATVGDIAAMDAYFQTEWGMNGSESDGTNIIPSGGVGLTSGWSAHNTTLTTAVTMAPDGTMTAALETENTANDRHILYRVDIPLAAATTYTFSVYAKMNGRRYLQIYMEGAGATRAYAFFDLQLGVVGDVGLSVGSGVVTPTSAIAVGFNGFYKCSVTATTVSGGTGTASINLSNVNTYGAPQANDTPTYAGDGSSGVYLWRPKVAA